MPGVTLPELHGGIFANGVAVAAFTVIASSAVSAAQALNTPQDANNTKKN